ncbi:MAG: L,D-transpeptidase [Anaerolineae bacterium]|jgi:hypothetical protein|nr:L,D-transpeptidase [Anaerolineae bacterium]
MKRTLVAALLVTVLAAGGLPSGALEAAHEPTGGMALAQGHPSCAGISLETPSTPECNALITARPAPGVSPVPLDYGVVNDVSFIRFTTSAVPLYDAPDGTQVETLSAGYTYVVPRQYQDGWAEVRPGRWVPPDIVRYASPSAFSGVFISGLDMPFAWVLWPHCAANAPAGTRSCEGAGQLRRYQLVNIYATVNVRGWNWHLIGPGLWTNQQNLSIVHPTAPATFGGRWVAVNTYEQNLVAYEGGQPVMATLVSSGLREEKWKTRTGTYSVRLMIENGPMSGSEGSDDFYSLEQVPYAIYFNGLVSLHGTYWHDSFGYTHSHGCVNLSISDAKWLFENWVAEGATVYVYDD